MSEYTATREGFQKAMEWSLTGPPEEAVDYVKGTTTSSFYHIMNGQRTDDLETYTRGIAEWRGKVSSYKPIVKEFLRDGDQLAARMTGTIDVEGQATEFESFMFGKIEKESGKFEYLVERSVWGAAGQKPTEGVN